MELFPFGSVNWHLAVCRASAVFPDVLREIILAEMIFRYPK
jgi:hypothetical protein